MRLTIRPLPVALVCLSLTACVSAEDRSANEAKVLAAREDAGMRPEKREMSLDEAKFAFVDKTRNVNAANLGSQISYVAPDGSAFLWFPGNRVVLRGTWAFRETGGIRNSTGKPTSRTSLCFTYGPNTYNAWSGKRGSDNCLPADHFVSLTFEAVDGDILGLSQRTEAPFVLSPVRTTLADLRKRVGSKI